MLVGKRIAFDEAREQAAQGVELRGGGTVGYYGTQNEGHTRARATRFDALTRTERAVYLAAIA